MFKSSLINFLSKNQFTQINPKAILFDMDGVLFNSMPNHAIAWQKACKEKGLTISEEQVYMNEGRTGKSMINMLYQKQLQREASQQEINTIYQLKTEIFNSLPEAEAMPGALELIIQIEAFGLTPMVVTGSGQKTLLERLNKSYPNVFDQNHIVSAYDVKYGKPHPEPYLKALDKIQLKPNEAIVVENAPLGVQSAVAATIFTVALNTGPLKDTVLLDQGADLLFRSMEEFNKEWKTLYQACIESLR